MSSNAAQAPMSVIGLACLERDAPLAPWRFERRALRPEDVHVEVMFCGVCHTDLHSIGKWGQAFPLVPGHEFVGRVAALGAAVSDFTVGDLVAIGTVVDSCRVCEACVAEEESYCHAFPTTTYDGVDRIDGSRTRGGYSSDYVCDQRFVFKLPDGMDLAGTAPLLCAGITSYSALRHWKAGPGMRVGVIGIGGLGHLAIKFAAAMGAETVAFTRSEEKAEEAIRLGANGAVVSTDEARMKAQAYGFDLLIDTVSDAYPMDPYLGVLKRNGTIVSLGLPDAFQASPFYLALGRRSIASSGTGGSREIREMLVFCAEHGITADVEVIKPEEIGKALERLARGDVRYRFVIDLQGFASTDVAALSPN